MAKKDAIARSLAPPFRIEPAALGFDSVFYLQLWVSFLSTLPSRLSLDAIRAPGPAFSFAVSPALMPGIFLLTFPSGKLPQLRRALHFCGVRSFMPAFIAGIFLSIFPSGKLPQPIRAFHFNGVRSFMPALMPGIFLSIFPSGKLPQLRRALHFNGVRSFMPTFIEGIFLLTFPRGKLPQPRRALHFCGVCSFVPAFIAGIFLSTFPKVITVPTPERKITVSLQGLVLSIKCE